MISLKGVLVIFFSLVTTLLMAQNNDTLKANIKSTLADCKSLFTSNKKQGEALGYKVYEMTKNKKEFITEFTDVHNMLGLYKMYAEKFAEAEKFLEEGLKLAIENNEKTIENKIRGNIGLNYMKRGDYQKCITATFALLPNLTGLNKANALGNIAACYSYLSQYDLSIKYQLEAMEIFKASNYMPGLAAGYNLIGSNYTKTKRDKEAIPYLLDAYNIRKQMKDSIYMANALINLGKAYFNLGNLANTRKYLKEAETLYKLLDNKVGLSKVYTNLGALYAKENNYKKSKEFELMAVELAQQTNDNYVLTTVYANLSKTYNQVRQLDSALLLKDKAMAAKDSLISLTTQQQIAEMQTKYETVKKEKQINEQQLLLKEQQFSIAKRNYAIAGASIFILLTGLLVWSFARRYKLKKEKELNEQLHLQQQQATIDILTAEEKERKRIASDLHDGVGQLMTAAWLNLQAVNANTEHQHTEQSQLISKTLHLVDESCKEVRAVSHNMMPNALLKKGLVNAVREFIQQINNKNTNINLQTDGLSKPLQSHVETVLYRVIQESVNNVIKHAAASSLDISINQDEEGIDVMIEDNGKGFNIAEAEKKDGIGLQNIRSRIQYLKGTVEWNSAENKGTLVAIHIPANVS